MQKGSTLPPVTQPASPALSYLTAKPGSNLAWYVKDATQGNWLLSRLAIVPATVLDGLDFLGDLVAGTWNAGVHLSRREYKLAANDATGAFWACLTRVAIASNNIFTIIDSGTRALEAYTNEMKPAHARQAGSQSIRLDFQAAQARLTKENEIQYKLNEWLKYIPNEKISELDKYVGNDVKLQKAKQLVQEYTLSLKASLQVAQEQSDNLKKELESAQKQSDNSEELQNLNNNLRISENRINDLTELLKNNELAINAIRNEQLDKVCALLDADSIQSIRAPNPGGNPQPVEDQLKLALMYLEVKLDSLKKLESNPQNQIKDDQQKIAKELEALKDQFQKLNERNNTAEKEKQELVENQKQLSEEIKRKDEHILSLKSQLSTEEKEKNAARQQVNAFSIENGLLKKELEALKEQANIIKMHEQPIEPTNQSPAPQNNPNVLITIAGEGNGSSSEDSLSESEEQPTPHSPENKEANDSNYGDYLTPVNPNSNESRLNNESILDQIDSPQSNLNIDAVSETKNEEEEEAPEQLLRKEFGQIKKSDRKFDKGGYRVSSQQNQTISKLLEAHEELTQFKNLWKSFGLGSGKNTEKLITKNQQNQLNKLLPQT